ncbi:hypothetical protein JDV02_008375 [Purpureocillium takamizusanense]|uniref:Uncharacterized protein n=1 Tax=Purpureocillium takamizusanense TaxID=2060973 RepID=A0A9Q8VF26_9HYPO|nr:uncharacterized protein JDV02_008375 [Purpureocillium takamizusanense]UNI22489.1 hypothetical protein JDV02_008375 [Purpureocillium takamizusanense]
MGETAGHLSPVYLDNIDNFLNASNVIQIPYSDFGKAATINTASIDGYDWTKPFPGSAVEGHEAHLYVTRDVPVPDDLSKNSTTTVSALTFSIPASMTNSSARLPVDMDPSWYICRHLFVSTNEQARKSVAEGNNCDFLDDTCRLDLINSLTRRWGKEDGPVMCSARAADSIPASCYDSFGHSRQDVIGFDSKQLADSNAAPLLTSDKLLEGTWRMGTGYNEAHDRHAYATAANRTYLIATVWGYARDIDPKHVQTPQVSLSCLSAWSPHDASQSASASGTATTSAKPSSTSSSTASRTGSNLARKLAAAAVAITAISLLSM